MFLCSIIPLMKALSHPGDGNSKCCIVGNWTWFSVLKTFHLPSKKLLQFLTNWGGVTGFLNGVGASSLSC